jgi:hypothetical protein
MKNLQRVETSSLIAVHPNVIPKSGYVRVAHNTTASVFQDPSSCGEAFPDRGRMVGKEEVIHPCPED